MDVFPHGPVSDWLDSFTPPMSVQHQLRKAGYPINDIRPTMRKMALREAAKAATTIEQLREVVYQLAL